jgi:hypothetical protein
MRFFPGQGFFGIGGARCLGVVLFLSENSARHGSGKTQGSSRDESDQRA